MEDILASIRRILSEDEGAPGAAAGGEAVQADAPAPEAGDDVFVLDHTMLIEEPAAMPSDEPFSPEHLAPEYRAPEYRAAEPAGVEAGGREGAPLQEQAGGEPLLAPAAAAAASASMGALVRVLGQQQIPVYRGGPTLEDMVREEIRPLVKSWLDENLAPMVERMVRAEIARVTGVK